GRTVRRLGTQRVYAWEGCLSVDGWQSIVPRSRRVRLQGTELEADGRLREIDEGHVGWPARILQHETDHLAGTLCHDLMVPRSFVEARYTSHYAQMPEAVRRLGLDGEITRLARAKWSWGESARAVGAEAVSAPAGQRDSLT